MDQQQLNEDRIRAARSTLLQRISRLERRVVGTTEDALDHVKETAATMKNAVSDTASDVRGVWDNMTSTVHDALDVSTFVRSNPWPTLALATAAGFAAGFFGRGGSPGMSTGFNREHMGIVSELMGMLRRELMSVGEATIAAGATAIKQNLQRIQAAASEPVAAHHNGRV